MPHDSGAAPALGFEVLKAKQRAIRAGFSEHFGLRVHRALSWCGRAGAESDDPDVRFLLLWIGFNAAYASDLRHELDSERGAFKGFFEALEQLDREHRIYNLVWRRFPHEIRLLLNNRYVFAPFWQHHNGALGYENWAERLTLSHRAIARALANQDTTTVLSTLFDRLYVLRNQLVHGGATWRSSVNRDQVRDGAALLGALLPVFIDIMMDNPDRDWGSPYYPVISA